MVVKVVEGEASHMLNTSEVRAWMAAALCFQTQCVDSGVACVLYACEGVYHVTPPHPPVHPVSLIHPASLMCPASLVHPASLACPTSLARPASLTHPVSRTLLHP